MHCGHWHHANNSRPQLWTLSLVWSSYAWLTAVFQSNLKHKTLTGATISFLSHLPMLSKLSKAIPYCILYYFKHIYIFKQFHTSHTVLRNNSTGNNSTIMLSEKQQWWGRLLLCYCDIAFSSINKMSILSNLHYSHNILWLFLLCQQTKGQIIIYTI